MLFATFTVVVVPNGRIIPIRDEVNRQRNPLTNFMKRLAQIRRFSKDTGNQTCHPGALFCAPGVRVRVRVRVRGPVFKMTKNNSTLKIAIIFTKLKRSYILFR